MHYNKIPHRRFQKSLEFLKEHVAPPSTILDLGIENQFSEIMRQHNYDVKNTAGEDLDKNTDVVKNDHSEIVTAFEILEHLVAPYNILKAIRAPKLIATVPLNLWFSNAYRSKTDSWDRHFHEFEDWQFDWLLEKSGWKIKKTQKWTNPVNKIGLRPLLRTFTPRYYAVYAERI